MNRSHLEHIVRAAAAITGATEIIVIGSQALLAEFPDAPPELLVSIEADVFTLRNPTDADLIDGSIGEGSPFHQTFGYYAHGVSEDTAVLPANWKDRLVPLQNENAGSATAFCLEIHDLAVSKLVAGREKDLEFVAGLLRHRMVEVEVVRRRLSETSMDRELLTLCEARLLRLSTLT